MRRKIIVTLVFLGALCAVPSANAYVYWLDYGTATIGRATLGAADQNNSFITGGSAYRALAVDANQIYWGIANPGAYVGTANLDGSGVNPGSISLGGTGAPFSLASNGDQLFITTVTSSPAFSIATGGTPVTGSSGGCGIAIDSTYLYWTEGQYIGRSLLNGTLPNHQWIDLGSPTLRACGLAVDSGHIYWANAPFGVAGTTIGRATIAGGSMEPNFITGAYFSTDISGFASDIAVDGNFLYWTNSNGSIGRASTDGTGVDQFFLTGMIQPIAIATDAGGGPPAPPGQVSHNPLPRPQLTGVVISSSSFAPSSGSTGLGGRTFSLIAKSVPRGTTFSFKLDQAATVTVSIEQKRAGRKVKGKCRKPTAKTAKKPKCNLVVATLTRDAHAGLNKLPFTGRIKKKALKVGSYQAVFTAKTAAGSSASKSVAFKIVKP